MVFYDFRWNQWNTDHIANHGIDPPDAEFVVCNARPPYPRKIGDDKFLVIGRNSQGAYVQVIYVFDPDASIFIIHARPLTDAEKRRFRRSNK
jgi:uncharacterized DUF497 family protein